MSGWKSISASTDTTMLCSSLTKKKKNENRCYWYLKWPHKAGDRRVSTPSVILIKIGFNKSKQSGDIYSDVGVYGAVCWVEYLQTVYLFLFFFFQNPGVSWTVWVEADPQMESCSGQMSPLLPVRRSSAPCAQCHPAAPSHTPTGTRPKSPASLNWRFFFVRLSCKCKCNVNVKNNNNKIKTILNAV